MKRRLLILAATAMAAALALPAIAEDKAAADAKAEGKAKTTKVQGKPHSHLEDRHGIKPSKTKKEPTEKKKDAHSHPRDR